MVLVDKVEGDDAEDGVIVGCVPHQLAMKLWVTEHRDFEAEFVDLADPLTFLRQRDVVTRLRATGVEQVTPLLIDLGLPALALANRCELEP
jgi:hypothetical protein